ncbi:MAG: phosphatase PAP2 family protein [Polyangiaceae bacterium]|nr:phosphatase PAP2 family protein [Polyangiaceae bacterium]
MREWMHIACAAAGAVLFTTALSGVALAQPADPAPAPAAPAAPQPTADPKPDLVPSEEAMPKVALQPAADPADALAQNGRNPPGSNTSTKPPEVDVITSAGRHPAPPGPRRVTEPSSSLAARLEWTWPKFGYAHLGLMLGQGALAVGSQAIPGMENWRGTNGFDEAARNALRLTDFDDSLVARDVSDIGLVLLINQRLVDTLFVTWWYHDKGSTALQMALIDAQTVSFSAGLNSLVAGLVGRERPYARSICSEGDTAKSSDCLGSNRFRSFFSGHATAAFTLAALTCTHHINVPIYGGGPVEAIPCAGTMLTASAVALLRVASDQHYLSDVLVGAVFGTASGFAMPYLFHYAHSPDAPNAALRALGVTTMSIGPSPGGIQMAGEF